VSIRGPLRFIASLLLGTGLVAIGAACGEGERDPAAGSASGGIAGKVTVFAASSLTDSFRSIGDAFTKAHPGITIEFNFASSSALATQIEQGAPADIFASADSLQIQRLVEKSLIEGAPVTFARNLPVIAVPADNRAGIATPKDLAKPGVKLVLASEDVPIGNYSREIIDRLAAEPAYGAAFKDAALKNVVSNEANVRVVLTKVELGEGDAGIVYRTDAQASNGRVTTVPLPADANVVASYPIAVVAASKNQDAASEFVLFVRGPEGQAVLRDAGFESP